MKIDFDKITRRFLLGEGKGSPNLKSYIQSVNDILNSLKPKTQTESRRVDVAKQQIREIKKLVYKLEHRLEELEQELKKEK